MDWPAILETNRPWLTRVLRCRIGDPHAVEDALQEIALLLVRQSQRPGEGGIPGEPEKIAPWLYRVAVRQAVNFHRKANRKTAPRIVSEIVVADSSQQPLDWLLAQEREQRFQAAYGRLSPAQREILTLKYSQKWDYQQLSEHLGIPVRSVEYRLLQARQELRKHLNLMDLE
jgi:RNA polymerase sigma factor (sigma-70 family)